MGDIVFFENAQYFYTIKEVFSQSRNRFELIKTFMYMMAIHIRRTMFDWTASDSDFKLYVTDEKY